MYLDKRNKNKVIIIKDGSKHAIVKSIKDSKKYLVDKKYLQEIT
jgi:hypothetical protein